MRKSLLAYYLFVYTLIAVAAGIVIHADADAATTTGNHYYNNATVPTQSQTSAAGWQP
jgi:hypothetical protein